MTRRQGSLKMWAGLAAGVAGVAVLLPGWTVRGGDTRPGAQITLAAQRSVDLDIQPVGRPLGTELLFPSATDPGARGALTARNATGDALRVMLRAGVDTRALDPLLRLRVTAAEKTLFAGTLGSLRRGVRLGTLPSHASIRLQIRAWLPAGAGDGYVGRRERITLSLLTHPVGRPS
jgi:hypothetical protein